MASRLDLVGSVRVTTADTNRALAATENRFVKLASSANTSSTTLKRHAAVMNTVAAATDKAAAATLKNARAEALAAAAQSKADAVRRTSLATAAATRAAGKGRAAVLAGQAQLAENKALGETIRQEIALQDAAGRAAQRKSQIANAATRTQIAQQRLLLQQQKAALTAGGLGGRFRGTEGIQGFQSALTSAGAAAGRFGTITGLALIGVAAEAIHMERQFVNVVRTSNIMEMSANKQGAAIDSLRRKFDALAQTLPISYKELTEIGTAAGQLGVRSQNVAAFTKTVATFSATTGVSVDQASTAFGRLDSLIVNVSRKGKLVGGVNHDYQALADSINKVGVNSVATDQQIINTASQISGIANAAGLGYKEVIGFSGALASVGVSPFLSRGLTTRLFGKIQMAIADGGEELTKFGQLAGMTGEQFAKAWGERPRDAIIALFQGINKSGDQAQNVLKNIGITSVLDIPALLRVARAANAAGEEGKLLEQTMTDAATAAGTTAAQYAKIAGTVQARLQVALNRAQILIRNIGNSNMGVLGKAIDDVSEGLLRMSQGLDKNFKFLGQFELPVKNSDLIGLGLAALTLLSGFTLLVSAAAKVGASFIAVGRAAAGTRAFLMGGTGGFAAWRAGAQQATVANEQYVASLAAVRGAQATVANGRLAAAAPSLAGTSRINSQTTMFAAQGRAAQLYANTVGRASVSVAQSLNRMQNSGSGVIRAFGRMGTAGQTALGAVGSAAAGVGRGIGRVAGSVGSFLGGPLGIISMGALAVVGINALRDSYRSLGSTAAQVSVALTRANSAMDVFNGVKTQQASGLEQLFGKSDMSAFVTSTAEFRQGLTNLGGGGMLSDFVQQFATLGQQRVNFEQFTQGLDKINAGFKNLSESGNTDAAINGIQKLFAGASDQQIANGLAHMGDVTSILSLRLNELGKTDSQKNLIALAKGAGQFSTAASKAAKDTADMTNAFHGNAQAAQDFINATQSAADRALNLQTAFDAAGKGKKGGSAGLGGFFKNAKAQVNDFVNFTGNTLKIAAAIGPEYLNQISQLSPKLVSEIVKGGKTAMDKLKAEFDRKDLVTTFRENTAALTQDPKLFKAFGEMGKKAQDAIIKSLSEGNSVKEAFAAAGKEGADALAKAAGKNPAEVKVKPKVDPLDAKQSLSELMSGKEYALSLKILGDAAPAIHEGETAREVIGNMKAYIKGHLDATLARREGESTAEQLSRLTAVMQVSGNTMPVFDMAQSASERVGMIQAIMRLEADPTRANETSDQVRTKINTLRAVLNIDGNPIPAQAKGETAEQYIDHLHGILQVDADTAMAATKGRSVAAQIGSYKGIIRILGDTAPAQNAGESAAQYLNRLKGIIKVDADTSPAEQEAVRLLNKANALRAKMGLGADPTAARQTGESTVDWLARLKARMQLDADSTKAHDKAAKAKINADRTVGRLKYDAVTSQAEAKRQAQKAKVDRTKGTMKVGADTKEAIAKSNAAKRHADSLYAKIHVSASTGEAEHQLAYLSRNRTAHLSVVQSIRRMATGGSVVGPGTSTSDSIPARLSNGEYVIRAAQARRFRTLLDNINYNGVARFATGGTVTGGSARYEGTTVRTTSEQHGRGQQIGVVELSAYDRHLLMDIRESVGITIGNDVIGIAAVKSNTRQGRRGNG